MFSSSAQSLICHNCGMVFNSINQLTLHRRKFCIGASHGTHPAPHSDTTMDEKTIQSKINQLLDIKEAALIRSMHFEDQEKHVVSQLRTKLGNRQPAQPRLSTVVPAMNLPAEVHKTEKADRDTVPISVVEDLLFTKRSGSSLSTGRFIDEGKSKLELDPLREPSSYLRLLKDLYGDKVPLHIVQRLLSDDYNVVTQLKSKLQQQVSALDSEFGMKVEQLKQKRDALKKSHRDVELRLSHLNSSSSLMGNHQYKAVGTKELSQRGKMDDWKSHIDQAIANQPQNQQSLLHEGLLSNELYDKQLEKEPFNFHGGSLVAEISALRQHYLNSGGTSTTILGQLTEMLNEAEDMNRQTVRVRRLPRERHERYDRETKWTDELTALELENSRLQHELLILQQKQAQPEHKPDVESLVEKLQREHLQNMMEQEKEIEFAKHQALLDKMKYDDRGRQLPRDDQPDYYSKITPVVHPTIYDPVEGFTCFYDFVTGLDASAKTCKLIISLYNKVSELGEPSLLPTVYTEQTVTGNTAIIGAKQPVPHCQADCTLSLVIELQTGESITAGKLKTKAWCKIELFNRNGQLNAGSWKVKFGPPPVRPDLNFTDLETNNTRSHQPISMYLRLANHIDAEVQTKLTISVYNHIDYTVPRK